MKILNLITHTATSLYGLKNIFVVLCVALFLSIYEISLFYLNLVPSIKSKINASIKEKNINIELENAEIYSLLTKGNKDNLFTDLLKVFDIREQRLHKQINTYTLVTAGILIFSLIYAILRIYKRVNITPDVWTTIIVTIALILIFQYLFYIYGLNYKYIDSISEDELKYYIINEI